MPRGQGLKRFKSAESRHINPLSLPITLFSAAATIIDKTIELILDLMIYDFRFQPHKANAF